jgi:predicted ATPase
MEPKSGSHRLQDRPKSRYFLISWPSISHGGTTGVLITRISVQNFKGLENLTVDFSKLNLFVGENGTGKSSIVHALGILKRSLGTSGINTDLPYLNLGPLQEIVPAGKTALIEVEGKLAVDLNPLVAPATEFNLKVAIDVQGLSDYSTKISFPTEITNTYTRYGFSKVEPTQLEFSGVTYNLNPTSEIGGGFAVGGYAVPSGPDQYRLLQLGRDIAKSLMQLSTVISQALSRTYVVPPLRGLTEPASTLLPSVTQELNPREGLPQMGAALVSNLTLLEPKIMDKIRSWMKETVNVDVDLRIIQGPQIKVLNPDRGTSLVNEGFGSNQLIFIFEEIARSEDDSFVAVEEPEIHLHPKAQFKLGQLMSKLAKENRQILLITHSEHIVSGVLTSVRQGVLKPEDVSIWFFRKEGEKISATKAEVDEQGKTSEGLTTFIKASVDELKEYIGVSS